MNQRAKKVRPAHSVDQRLLRVSPRDLDTLLSTLDVPLVAFSECLVSAGFRLEMGGIDAPGIRYNIAGMRRIFIQDRRRQRFSMLRDPQIACAFSEMAAQPGGIIRFRVCRSVQP